MSLTTEFQGIAEDKLDERIDALTSLIQEELTPILEEIQRTVAEFRNSQGWYKDNALETAYSSIQENSPLNKEGVEADVGKKEVILNEEDTSSLTSQLSDAVSKRPDPGLWTWLKGESKQVRLDYLNSLKETGDALIAEAQEELARRKNQLSAAKQSHWENLVQLHDFYEGFAAAIISKNHKAILASLNSASAEGITPYAKSELIARPLNGYDSAFEAIANMDFPDQNTESEIIANIMNGIGSDNEALRVICGMISSISDQDQAGKYTKYASAFSGTFIPVGDKAVNVNLIGYASSSNAVVLGSSSSGRGYPERVNLRENNDAILSALSENKSFVRLGENVINTNMIGFATSRNVIVTGSSTSGRGYPERLSIGEKGESFLNELEKRPNFIRVGEAVVNSNKVGYVNKNNVIVTGSSTSGRGYPERFSIGDDAQDIMDAFAKLPNFIKVGDDIVNANMIGYADERTLVVPGCSSSGRGYPQTYDVTDNQDILNTLADLPNFVRVGKSVVNIHKIGYADQRSLIVTGSSTSGRGYPKTIDIQDDSQAVFSELAKHSQFIKAGNNIINANMVGYADDRSIVVTSSSSSGRGYPKTLDVRENSEAILSALAKRPNFIRVGDVLINLNKVGYVDKRNTAVVLGSSSSGRGYPKSLRAGEDGDLYKQARQWGQRMSVLQTYAGQRNELLHGLQEARAWELSSQSASSVNNGDTLTDYLPFIIIGAIILLNDNDHTDMGVVDQSVDDAHDLGASEAELGDAGFEGTGIDSDFAGASGVDGLETSLDNGDMGIDSFEADFADMDTGFDGGMDDFDTGGSGMDSFDTGFDSSSFDSGFSGGFDGGGMGL